MLIFMSVETVPAAFWNHDHFAGFRTRSIVRAVEEYPSKQTVADLTLFMAPIVATDGRQLYSNP